QTLVNPERRQRTVGGIDRGRRKAQVAQRRGATPPIALSDLIRGAGRQSKDPIGGLLGGRPTVESPRSVGVLGLTQPLFRPTDGGLDLRRQLRSQLAKATERVGRRVVRRDVPLVDPVELVDLRAKDVL